MVGATLLRELAEPPAGIGENETPLSIAQRIMFSEEARYVCGPPSVPMFALGLVCLIPLLFLLRAGALNFK